MITINDGGFLSTIQDRGRPGYRAFGMPLSGALDSFSSRVANMLVGNREDAALVEMTVKGASFTFGIDTLASLTGANMCACLDGEKVQNWSSFFVSSGSMLTLGFTMTGMRSYLAVRGGINTAPFLGSRSTYLPGKVGGVNGRALGKGDVLVTGSDTEKRGRIIILPGIFVPEYNGDIVLRALPGPRDDAFTDESLLCFFSHPYTILPESDRMGYRLEGPRLEFREESDIISEPMSPGSVQVPGNGQPILLLADSQSTGGYYRIATVIGTDLPLAAQSQPGEKVWFKQVSEREAIGSFMREKEMFEDISIYIESGFREDISSRYRVHVNGRQFLVQVENSGTTGAMPGRHK